MRTCVVCRRRREDDDLERAGRVAGEWYRGRGPGRGLWWCRDGECGERVSVSLASRALRVALVAEDLEGWRELALRSN